MVLVSAAARRSTSHRGARLPCFDPPSCLWV